MSRYILHLVKVELDDEISFIKWDMENCGNFWWCSCLKIGYVLINKTQYIPIFNGKCFLKNICNMNINENKKKYEWNNVNKISSCSTQDYSVK